MPDSRDNNEQRNLPGAIVMAEGEAPHAHSHRAHARCMLRSFVDFQVLQRLRHSHASRAADFAAPRLIIVLRRSTSMRYAAASVCSLHARFTRCSAAPRTLAMPLQGVFSIPCSDFLL